MLSFALIFIAALFGPCGKLGQLIDEYFVDTVARQRHLAMLCRWYESIESARIPDLPRLASRYLLDHGRRLIGPRLLSARSILAVAFCSFLLTICTLALGFYVNNEVSEGWPDVGPMSAAMRGNRALFWIKDHVSLDLGYSLSGARLLGALLAAAHHTEYLVVNLIFDAATCVVFGWTLKRIVNATTLAVYGLLLVNLLAAAVFAAACLTTATCLVYPADYVFGALRSCGNPHFLWRALTDLDWSVLYAITTFFPVLLVSVALWVLLVVRVSMSSLRWTAWVFTRNVSHRQIQDVRLFRAFGLTLDVIAGLLGSLAVLLRTTIR